MRCPGGPAMLAPRRATMGGSAPTGLWEGPETVRFRTQDGGHLTADAAGASAGEYGALQLRRHGGCPARRRFDRRGVRAARPEQAVLNAIQRGGSPLQARYTKPTERAWRGPRHGLYTVRVKRPASIVGSRWHPPNTAKPRDAL